MTSERANDKCEACGKKFKTIQTHAPFEADLRCVECSFDYYMTFAECIDFPPEDNKSK